MQSWAYVHRPKAIQPEKKEVELVISDLWRGIKNQASAGAIPTPSQFICEGTELLYETLSMCAVALNSEQEEIFSSKRSAARALQSVQQDIEVLRRYNVEKKISPEARFMLQGTLQSAQEFLRSAKQGPKQDFYVRAMFDALYCDWMILTDAGKKFLGLSFECSAEARSHFIAEAWAVIFPESELIPARTLRDWEKDVRIETVEHGPRFVRQMSLNFLPKS